MSPTSMAACQTICSVCTEQGKPLDGYMLGRFEKHFERTRLQHKEDL